ncbi:MAG: glycerophosphoryl diester phosphodiesterase membrane domain-containing protein [Actinobacteria bacterium]|nr:glycerophosphoryl diester phosphodiesterase membrane domain-containing protein [Actinomycetota bacterium]
MTVGGVLSEAFALYRRFFTRFFLTAAAVFVVLNLFSAIAADAGADADDAVAAFWGLIGLVVTLVGSLWVQGALTATVADVRDGRADEDIEATYRRVRPTLLPLLLAGIMAGIGILIGLVLLIVPGLFLLTRWVLVTPAVVLERLGPTDALRRSWDLVKGHGWTAFGVIVVTIILAAAAQFLFIGVFAFLPNFLQNWIGGLVANSLVTPFVALSWTLMYFHLRGGAPVTVLPA